MYKNLTRLMASDLPSARRNLACVIIILTHCVPLSSVAVAKSKLLMHLPFIHCNLGHDIYLTKRTYFHTHSAEIFFASRAPAFKH